MKKAVNNSELVQWINGSFVTKHAKPQDIDLVTFINAEDIAIVGDLVKSFAYPMSDMIYGVDAYIVTVYNRENRNYPLYMGDKMYWMDKFDKTRRTRSGQKQPKGFLEIIY